MIKCQQHLVFPGGHPSKYWPDPTLLNFADRTRSGVLNVVWPLARRTDAMLSMYLHVPVMILHWKSKKYISHYRFTRKILKCKSDFNFRHIAFFTKFNSYMQCIQAPIKSKVCQNKNDDIFCDEIPIQTHIFVRNKIVLRVHQLSWTLHAIYCKEKP